MGSWFFSDSQQQLTKKLGWKFGGHPVVVPTVFQVVRCIAAPIPKHCQPFLSLA
jgi:hypothetical protein